VRGIHLTPVKKHFHDNGGAAQADEKTRKNRFIPLMKE
jgi:hypothetical protein